MLPAQEVDAPQLEGLFSPLVDRARSDLRVEGLSEEVTLMPALDMRYHGQSYELSVELRGSGFLQDFHDTHLRRFSYASETEPVEIVNLRL